MGMNETNNSDKPIGGAPPKATLHLKRPVEQGTVRQSFSHGRSKAVVVEKVKRRVLGPGETAPAVSGTSAPTKPTISIAPRGPTSAGQAKPAAPPRPKTGVVLPTLTVEQREARARALLDARAREEEDRRRQEAEAEARREREARERSEREAAEARKREEELRRAQEANFKRQSEEEARWRLAGGEPAPSPSIPRKAPAAGVAPAPALARAGEEEPRAARRPALAPMLPQKVLTPTPRPARGAEQRNRGRLTVANATSIEEERMRSVASFRRRTQRLKGHGAQDHKEKIAREIVLPEAITIQELASRMSERAVDVIKLLMRQGRMVTLTDVLDADTAELIAEEMGHTVKRVAESDVEEGLFDRPDEEGATVPRPPIVTIMGHVDHGKTSLLDAIRHANVVAGEAGGITQHIGAYQVVAPGGQTITFIDTPGHAAFTAMRARGAKVTDIVVLVVAADDGVMPQTIEAIRHAKAANAPIIVAINKMDKPDANPARVRTELLSHDIVVEAMGGETQDVEVSALKKTGLDKLEEAILLQAEVLDLKANPDRAAEGSVIESRLDRGRGPVATILVQKGTLNQGDIVVAGAEWGRVRAMLDDKARAVAEAGPSVPVEILGLAGVPHAGEPFVAVENEGRAREIAEFRTRKLRDKAAGVTAGARGTLDEMLARIQAGEQKEVTVLIKADVQGSAEAIQVVVQKLAHEEVKVRVLLSGVGQITESDVQLAKASNAVIIGFNVRATAQARELAQRESVDIRYFSI